jgi:hypothetical protein
MDTLKQRLRNETERTMALEACGGRPVLQVGRRFRITSLYGLEDSRPTFVEASSRAAGLAAIYRIQGDMPAAQSLKVLDSQPWRESKDIKAGRLKYTRVEGVRGMGERNTPSCDGTAGGTGNG